MSTVQVGPSRLATCTAAINSRPRRLSSKCPSSFPSSSPLLPARHQTTRNTRELSSRNSGGGRHTGKLSRASTEIGRRCSKKSLLFSIRTWVLDLFSFLCFVFFCFSSFTCFFLSTPCSTLFWESLGNSTRSIDRPLMTA